MLARLQQIIVFVLAATTSAWVGYFLGNGATTWALAGPVFLLAGYAGAIGLEFLLLRRTYAALDSDRPTFFAFASAWWKEVIAAPRVFLWRQPFRSHAIADSVPSPPIRNRGAVLIHGFVCNRGLWNPWMASFLRARVPFVALTLEPIFGSIDQYAGQIEDAVRRLEAATGLAPVLVAHSMGGLAARAWAVKNASPGRVFRVVTIGTPHRGTALARHSYTTNSRQMRPGSAWLEALARAESTQDPAAITCFWSRCDNIVFPTESATLPGADNRHLDATPHVRMVYHPEVIAEVLRLVETADRD